MKNNRDKSGDIATAGCIVIPILIVLFGGLYSAYEYIDENWFFTDYRSIRIEDACKTGKLKRGIYSGNFTLYDQKDRFFDSGIGEVRVKGGEVLGVNCRVPGSRGESVPTVVRITLCGQDYNFNIREEAGE